MQRQNSELNLSPFRRRIRLLRIWRCCAVSGCIGASVALGMTLLDYFGIVFFTVKITAMPVLVGILLGLARGLTENIPDDIVARSVDQRSRLQDRLTTAMEIPSDLGALSEAQHTDASSRLESLRPGALYPVRFGRWQGALMVLCALGSLVFLLGNTSVFKSVQGKKDAAELAQQAKEVQRIARPILEQAKSPDATQEEKDLARRMDRFASELRKDRMSKQAAAIKASQLAEQAQKLQRSHTAALINSIESAQTAAGKLQNMNAQSHIEKSDEMKLAEQASALQKQIAEAQRQLDAAKAGKSSLSPQERKQLEKSLAQSKLKLKQVQLSQQAQDLMRKLAANPDYQEAQKLLQKLNASATAQQAGGQSTMTQAQLDAAAKRLEELAKQLNTDEKMREYAKKLLEIAKNARLGNKSGLGGAGLLGAFGMGNSMGGFSMGGMTGAGAPSPDRWVGAHGTLSRDDKSSLLNVKFKDRVITSQIGKNGSETYTEVLGPSASGDKSAVPFQKVLPKYEKSAETSLNKGEIPPQMRGKVRDYFDSLRQ